MKKPTIFEIVISANLILNATFAVLFYAADAQDAAQRHLVFSVALLGLLHLDLLITLLIQSFPRKRPCERCKAKTTHKHTSLLDPSDTVYLCQSCCDALEREARQSLQTILQEFGPPKRSYDASPKIH